MPKLERVLLFAGSIVWVTVANIAPLIEIVRVSLLDVSPAAPDHVEKATTAMRDCLALKLAQDGHET